MFVEISNGQRCGVKLWSAVEKISKYQIIFNGLSRNGPNSIVSKGS